MIQGDTSSHSFGQPFAKRYAFLCDLPINVQFRPSQFGELEYDNLDTGLIMVCSTTKGGALTSWLTRLLVAQALATAAMQHLGGKLLFPVLACPVYMTQGPAPQCSNCLPMVSGINSWNVKKLDATDLTSPASANVKDYGSCSSSKSGGHNCQSVFYISCTNGLLLYHNSTVNA